LGGTKNGFKFESNSGLEMGLIKSGELLEYPNAKTRATGSQALEGIGSKEGSEANGVSPNNNPLQECPIPYYNVKRWSELMGDHKK